MKRGVCDINFMSCYYINAGKVLNHTLMSTFLIFTKSLTFSVDVHELGHNSSVIVRFVWMHGVLGQI